MASPTTATAAAPVGVLDAEREAEGHNALGNNAFKENKFDVAIRHYTDAIQFDPLNPKFYSNRSYSQSKLNAWTAAYSDAEAATVLEPSGEKYWFRKISALVGLRQFSAAEAEAEQFFRRFPATKLREPITKAITEDSGSRAGGTARGVAGSDVGCCPILAPPDDGRFDWDEASPTHYMSLVMSFGSMAESFAYLWWDPFSKRESTHPNDAVVDAARFVVDAYLLHCHVRKHQPVSASGLLCFVLKGARHSIIPAYGLRRSRFSLSPFEIVRLGVAWLSLPGDRASILARWAFTAYASPYVVKAMEYLGNACTLQIGMSHADEDYAATLPCDGISSPRGSKQQQQQQQQQGAAILNEGCGHLSYWGGRVIPCLEVFVKRYASAPNDEACTMTVLTATALSLALGVRETMQPSLAAVAVLIPWRAPEHMALWNHTVFSDYERAGGSGAPTEQQPLPTCREVVAAWLLVLTAHGWRFTAKTAGRFMQFLIELQPPQRTEDDRVSAVGMAVTKMMQSAPRSETGKLVHAIVAARPHRYGLRAEVLSAIDDFMNAVFM